MNPIVNFQVELVKLEAHIEVLEALLGESVREKCHGSPMARNTASKISEWLGGIKKSIPDQKKRVESIKVLAR